MDTLPHDFESAQLRIKFISYSYFINKMKVLDHRDKFAVALLLKELEEIAA